MPLGVLPPVEKAAIQMLPLVVTRALWRCLQILWRHSNRSSPGSTARQGRHEISHMCRLNVRPQHDQETEPRTATTLWNSGQGYSSRQILSGQTNPDLLPLDQSPHRQRGGRQSSQPSPLGRRHQTSGTHGDTTRDESREPETQEQVEDGTHLRAQLFHLQL